MVEWRAMRPIRARIDSGALRHNLGVAKRRAPRSRAWAVVKANAYGHGLARSAKALAAADGLALIELDAAIELRNAGERRPILLLQGFYSPEELEPIAASGIPVRSANSMSIATRPSVRVRLPHTRIGVPVGAWRG